MKRIFILAIVFLISSCFAQELEFQQKEYSPSETILGQIENVVKEIQDSDFKIYEGRREVFFERSFMKVNNTLYYYLIPTKEGNFSLEIGNVFCNRSGVASAISFEKNFEVVKRNNSLKFGIRPGVYEGQNPVFIITNLVSEDINVSIGKKQESLKPYESKKITIGSLEDGFGLYKIGDYEIPINKFSIYNNENNVSAVSEKPENETELKPGCISFEVVPLIGAEVNKERNLSMRVKNNCSEKFNSLEIKSSGKQIKFKEDNFSLDAFGFKEVNFSIVTTTLGKNTINLSIFNDSKQIYFEQLIIYSFENETKADIIKVPDKNTPLRTCASEGGKFCGEGESCETDDGRYHFWDFDANQMCCLVECVNYNHQPTNWTNILVGFVGLATISAVIYFISKKVKKLKSPDAEDKFKEAEKKYETKFAKSEKK